MQLGASIFLVTEAIEGGSLEANMFRHFQAQHATGAQAGAPLFAEAEVQGLARTLLRTLAEMHACSIVHHNVESILCVERGNIDNVKLGDFEFSRAIGAEMGMRSGSRLWDSFTPPEMCVRAKQGGAADHD